MANSLPWSVKGIDPRTRDAAKAAARRAGMTLGEWLDNVIREEAGEVGEAAPPARPAQAKPSQPEQLDIQALGQRLAQISQAQTETSVQAPASAMAAAEASRSEIDAVLGRAASAERLTRESTAQTLGALDSIARWIEKTESRISNNERAAAERQERATAVMADAIKTMSEKLVEIEQKAGEAASRQSAVQPRPALATVAGRPVLSRDGLGAAISDIRSRQAALDEERLPEQPAAPTPEARIASLRDELRALSSRLPRPAAEAPARPAPAQPEFARTAFSSLENAIGELGARLDRLPTRDRLEPMLKPLARIEAEIAQIATSRPEEAISRFENEIAHLAARIDALAQRGGDRTLLAPILREIGDLREAMSSAGQAPRLEEMSQQLAALANDVGRVRDSQIDRADLRDLSLAIDDVRSAILNDRAQPSPALTALSRQVEMLSQRVETLPAMKPAAIDAQIGQLFAKLDAVAATGAPASAEVHRRIDALASRLEALASDGAARIGERIDRLQARIEGLAPPNMAPIEKQIAALAARIESMAASNALVQLASEGGAGMRADLSPVEDMLRALATKIDEAGRSDANADSFDALERQIAGLATRLDEAAATRSAEHGIERTLQDLVVHLQRLREDATAGAERAAHVAVAEMAAKVGRSEPPAGQLAALSSLISDLRDTQSSSGRQTRDAIGAVHQTLETIISRLASLETEISTERGEASRHALRTAPAVRMPEARLTAGKLEPAPFGEPDDSPARGRRPAGPAETATPPLPELDIPLEPGSGRPRPDANAAAAGGQDPLAIRQNLIAAARRSAKAAADAAMSAPAPNAEAKAGKPAKSASIRLKDIMEKRRRPLLLGLAAVVLAMGAAHVVTGRLQGDGARIKPAGKEATLGTETAPAAEPKAPAATAPATPPAKDQGAALPAPQADAAAGLAAAASQAAAPVADATAAAPATTAALPPSAAPEQIQPVTGLGDLPATIGTAGLRKAALGGDARAVYELAVRAADAPAAQRDPKLALRLFERASVAGLAPAQFRLGNMFEKGIGTQRDIALARIWYGRAAERGNAKAMHNLAVLYAEGADGKADYATATEWFRRAADLGVRDSQYNLAILLGRGLGAPADLGQSYLWFAVAAAQGDEDAARKRDEVATRLSQPELEAARSRVQAWKPKPLDAIANEVAPPAKGWDGTPSAAAAKPAKPARS